MENFKKIIRRLEGLNWDDIEQVNFYTQKILLEIYSSKSILRSFLDSLLNNNDLIYLCEHYDFFDKLILYTEINLIDFGLDFMSSCQKAIKIERITTDGFILL